MWQLPLAPREEGGTRQGLPEANEMNFGGSLRCVTEGAYGRLTDNIIARVPTIALYKHHNLCYNKLGKVVWI